MFENRRRGKGGGGQEGGEEVTVTAQVKDEGGWDQGSGSEGSEEALVLNIMEGRINRIC